MECPEIAKQGKTYILNIRYPYGHPVKQPPLLAIQHKQVSIPDQSALTDANACPLGPSKLAAVPEGAALGAVEGRLWWRPLCGVGGGSKVNRPGATKHVQEKSNKPS